MKVSSSHLCLSVVAVLSFLLLSACESQEHKASFFFEKELQCQEGDTYLMEECTAIPNHTLEVEEELDDSYMVHLERTVRNMKIESLLKELTLSRHKSVLILLCKGDSEQRNQNLDRIIRQCLFNGIRIYTRQTVSNGEMPYVVYSYPQSSRKK